MRAVPVFLLLALCASPAAAESAADVKREAGETADAAASYARRQKDEYAAKIGAELDELDRRIDELKARSKKAGRDTRAALRKRVRQLEDKRRVAASKLKELRRSTGGAWEDLKRGLDSAVGELRDSLRRAGEEFHEKG